MTRSQARSHVAHKTSVTTRILKDFDDPTFTEEQWMQLLHKGNIDTVNLTWRWQRCWWRSFGRGQLLLILAEDNGQPVALAPLFEDCGMIFNICPEDALDFVGDISRPDVLDALLQTAMAAVTNFVGFRLYFIPDVSSTGEFLKNAVQRLGLICHNEGDLPSPAMCLASKPEKAFAATRKKSLVRHENFFRRKGLFEAHHFNTAAEILPHLNTFFEQHIARRNATDAQSLFTRAEQRAYYRQFTLDVGPTGWLRFTRLTWNDRPIAFHYGLSYKGRYLFGIPSFDIELSRHSPGEVLLRQLLLAAIGEGAAIFDFGIGDEAYKYRFSTHVNHLRTWGVYP